MTDNDSQRKISIHVPGEAIDKATAEVIAALAGTTSKGIADVGGNIFGGLLGDRIREWRTRNLVATASKTAAILKERGVDLKKARALPMGEIYALFDGASKQEDPDLQKMWAALLTTSLDPSLDGIDTSYISVLEQLSSRDVKVFQFVGEYASAREQYDKGFGSRPRTFGDIISEKGKRLTTEFHQQIDEFLSKLNTFDDSQISQSLDSLQRYKLIAPALDTLPRHIWNSSLETRHRPYDREDYTIVVTKKIADNLNKFSSVLKSLHGIVEDEIRLMDPMNRYYCLHQHTKFGYRFWSACSP